MVIRSKKELAEILVKDSKMYSEAEPEMFERMLANICKKSNEWFIRAFRVYDYKLTVQPNEQFSIV